MSVILLSFSKVGGGGGRIGAVSACENECVPGYDINFCGIIIEGQGQVNIIILILKWFNFVTHCGLSFIVVEKRVFKFITHLRKKNIKQ